MSKRDAASVTQPGGTASAAQPGALFRRIRLGTLNHEQPQFAAACSMQLQRVVERCMLEGELDCYLASNVGWHAPQDAEELLILEAKGFIIILWHS